MTKYIKFSENILTYVKVGANIKATRGKALS